MRVGTCVMQVFGMGGGDDECKGSKMGMEALFALQNCYSNEFGG